MKLAKNNLFHHHNAPVQTSIILMTKIINIKLEFLPHAPYSRKIVSFGYFLFPNLKKGFGGRRFSKSEEEESAEDGSFEEIDGSHLKQGIEAIRHSWGKCIEKLRFFTIFFKYVI